MTYHFGSTRPADLGIDDGVSDGRGASYPAFAVVSASPYPIKRLLALSSLIYFVLALVSRCYQYSALWACNCITRTMLVVLWNAALTNNYIAVSFVRFNHIYNT